VLLTDAERGEQSLDVKVESDARPVLSLRVFFHLPTKAGSIGELIAPDPFSDLLERFSESTLTIQIDNTTWELPVATIRGSAPSDPEVKPLVESLSEEALTALTDLVDLGSYPGVLLIARQELCDYLSWAVGTACAAPLHERPRWVRADEDACDFDASFGFPCDPEAIDLKKLHHETAGTEAGPREPDETTPPVAAPTAESEPQIGAGTDNAETREVKLLADELRAADHDRLHRILSHPLPEGMAQQTVLDILFRRVLEDPGGEDLCSLVPFVPFKGPPANEAEYLASEAELEDQVPLLRVWADIGAGGALPRERLIRAVACHPGADRVTGCYHECAAKSKIEDALGAQGIPVFVDPQVTGAVSFDIWKLLWPELLDGVCAIVGCRWEVEPGDPPRVEVVPAELRHTTVTIDGHTAEPQGMHADELLRAVADQAGLGLEIDPRVNLRVSFRAQGMEWPTAVDLICRRAGCRWERIFTDEGQRLVVTTVSEEEPRSLDLVFEATPVEEAARTLADMRGLELKLSDWFDPEHPITLDSGGRSWSQVLWALCEEISGQWKVTERKTLLIQPHGGTSHWFPAFIPPVELEVRLEVNGEETVARRVRFALDRRGAVVQPAEESGPTLLLSWLPLADDLQMVGGALVWCGRDERRHVEAVRPLEPVQLPPRGVWEHGDVSVRLALDPDPQLALAPPVAAWEGRVCAGEHRVAELRPWPGTLVVEVHDPSQGWQRCIGGYHLSRAWPLLWSGFDLPEHDGRRRIPVPGLVLAELDSSSEDEERVLALWRDPVQRSIERETLVFPPRGIEELRLPLEDGASLRVRFLRWDPSMDQVH
jgi:hypothetical protein